MEGELALVMLESKYKEYIEKNADVELEDLLYMEEHALWGKVLQCWL